MMIINGVLTVIFTLESILKIYGLGPKIFWMDKMNRFDLFVVIFSVLELVIDLYCRAEDVDNPLPVPLSVLRAFRIFRLFKLVRSIPSLRKILTTLAQSMASVVYLAMLLVLMILIFVLLGMELFGGFYPRPEYNYTEDFFPKVWEKDVFNADEASRYHFDDIGTATLAIFVVLSGENWNEIMFDSHSATWDSNRADSLPLPYAMIYFIFLFILGNLLLFNLFIAILLSNFDDDDEEEEVEEEVEEPKTMEWRFNGYATSSSNLTSRVS